MWFFLTLLLSICLAPVVSYADGSIWCPPDMVVSPDGNGCDEVPISQQWKTCPNGGRVRYDKICPLIGAPENPHGYVSGVGVISGWLCEARKVVVEFDRDRKLRWEVSYGSRRDDTYEYCSDRHNGYGLLFNWNLLGDGEHTMRLIRNGRFWKNPDGSVWETVFTVTTFGEEFARDLQGTCTVQNFPDKGAMVELQWSESLQNFVIVP